MPYVLPSTREMLEPIVGGISEAVDKVPPGVLNYIITEACLLWVRARNDGKLDYDTLNSAIGVLECAKLELYRRMVAPYEDEKIAENGDVFGRIASSLDDEVRRLCAGQYGRIKAIKHVRNVKGLPLKEAKEYVDRVCPIPAS
jgi:uncharacterized protein DUF6899/ribosomal L7/L12-like protein